MVSDGIGNHSSEKKQLFYQLFCEEPVPVQAKKSEVLAYVSKVKFQLF